MNKKGFTLIELLVVVIMVGVLTSVALPQYRRTLDRARAAEVKQLLPALYEARERWVLENGYHWDDRRRRIVDPEGNPVAGPTYAQLDIEVKLADPRGVDKVEFSTENFKYNLLGHNWNLGGGINARSVYATPLFHAKSRNNLGGSVISYTNGKVCCSMVASLQRDDLCERLDIPACVVRSRNNSGD